MSASARLADTGRAEGRRGNDGVITDRGTLDWIDISYVDLSGEGKPFSEQGGIVIVGQAPGATFKPARCRSAAWLLHSQT